MRKEVKEESGGEAGGEVEVGGGGAGDAASIMISRETRGGFFCSTVFFDSTQCEILTQTENKMLQRKRRLQRQKRKGF